MVNLAFLLDLILKYNFLDHLLHETLRVTIFFDVFPLNSQHARERGNIDLKRGIHFFEPPGSDIDFEDEMVDEKGEEK